MVTEQTITDAEQQVLWVLSEGRRGHPPAGFHAALIRAIFCADANNRDKLRTVYSELVGAVEAWQNGDLYKRALAIERNK